MTPTIRAATPDDAEGVARVLNGVIAEREFTTFDRPFSIDDEHAFLLSLGDRERVTVAVVGDDIIGVQSVGPFMPGAEATRHVATMGTWIDAGHRGRGVGRELSRASMSFAAGCGYRKILIWVLAGNAQALAFYKARGFSEVGLAKQHACVRGEFKDEVFLEAAL